MQTYPDVAFGGGNYTVVWSDNRSSYSNVYAARVTPAGTVLEPNGIQVGPATATFQYQPAIAFDGTRFFVAWGYMTPYAITGRFINIDGTPEDTVRIADVGDKTADVSIAFDGTNYLVVWTEYTVSGYIVNARFVSTTGVPIGSVFTIASPVYRMSSLDMCFDGHNYFVTYCSDTSGYYQIYGRKYNPSGVPVGGAFRISTSSYDSYFCSVIPGSDNHYLNVWSEDRGTSYDIYGNVDIEILGIDEENAPPATYEKTIQTIFSGPLQLPEDKNCSIFDITGRLIMPDCMKPGIYFIEVGGEIKQKVVKIR